MRAAVIAAFLIAVCLTFRGVGESEFVLLDDDMHISNNPHLRNDGGGLEKIWAEPYQGLYIPVTYTAWAAQKAVFEKYWATWGPGGKRREAEARFYHSVNLGLHATNAFLVFTLLSLLLGVPWVSLAGALLFTFHPVQVEPIAWISGLKDLLSGFFSLLFLILYLSAGIRLRAKQKGVAWRYAAAALFFPLAMLSKPSAVMLPVIAFFFEWGVLREKALTAAMRTGVAALLALPLAWITKAAQPSFNLTYVAPWFTRPLIASDALTFYFSKLLVPLRLAPDYGRHPSLFLNSPWPWSTWLVPTLLFYVLLKRRRTTQTAFAVFLAALAPVLGFIPFYFQEFSTVADRYLYLAILGPILLACVYLKDHPTVKAKAFVAVALVVLCGLSHRQAGYWRDSTALFEQTIAVNPNSILAHNNIGTILEEKGDNLQAAYHYREVLRIEPGNIAGHYNLARLLAKLGHVDWAIDEFRQVIAKAPGIADAQFSLGILEARKGNYEEAKAHLFLSLHQRPTHTPTLAQLGTVFRETDDCAQALKYYDATLFREPSSPEALFGKGKCLRKMGKRKDAIRYFEAAAQVMPDWDTPKKEVAELTGNRKS